jgi:Leucine-rich repeat (LRR) protein
MQRRGAGAAASSEPELVLGHQNLSKAFIQARFSGHLKLQARGLTMLPPLCCNIGSVVLPEGSAWWETRETLETMDVSQNELISLPDELGTLEDLQQLDATNNRLRVLPPVLAELPALKKLMLAHNQLTQLPELGAFNLPPLVQLVASHNALTAVPPSFAGLIYLVELDLSHNRLGTLPSGLGGMRALKTLMLAKNELIELPADLVQSPPPLVSLDASENRLRRLRLSVPSLRTLLLANNRLESLELQGCAGLQELSAPFNIFGVLPSGMPYLAQLATVDLSSNKLTEVEQLSACASLTRLDLSCNELREVPPLLGNLSLNKLALSGNPLRTMPSAVLNGPTPKLLAHLRGKIVDTSPQWDGDIRGQMAPMQIDRSLGALGDENRPAQTPHQQHRQQHQHQHQQVMPYAAQQQQHPQATMQQQYLQQQQEMLHYGGGAAYSAGGSGGGFGRMAPPRGADSRASERGFDALYNRPPSQPTSERASSSRTSSRGPSPALQRPAQLQPPPAPPPSRPTHSVSASAPFQTETNSRPAPPASALDGLYSHVIKDGTELKVDGLKLTALPSDGYPETLHTIFAASNQLRALPDGLSGLIPGLRCLDVSKNALSLLPFDLGGCPELQAVRVAHNQLRDLGFVGVVLSSLTELNADRNVLVEVPAALWLCPRLRTVSLCANKLTAASLHMPGGGAAAPLEYLDLGENRLGALPPLALFPRLREVHVQQNGIRELPVEHLMPLQKLQTLDISCNDVTMLPAELALLPVLQNLTIVGNAIRSIPQNVQQRGATAVLDLLKKRLPG